MYITSHFVLTVIDAKSCLCSVNHSSVITLHESNVHRRQEVAGPCIFAFAGKTDRKYFLAGVLLTPFA